MKSLKISKMPETGLEPSKLSLNSNRRTCNENALMESELIFVEKIENQPIQHKRFANLLSMKVKLAKRISKLKNLEEIYHKIEKQNKESDQGVILSILHTLRTNVLTNKPLISDTEIYSYLDFIDVRTIDIERFVDALFKKEKNFMKTNTTRTDNLS